MENKKFEKILSFVMKKHSGQIDKAGKPYFLHPLTVAFSCHSESARIVALLHDVLEDTDATIEELKKLGISDEELSAIQLLTKPKKEDYMHYIKRVAQNPLAREVKMCDLTHNMDLSRLPFLTEKDIARCEKYKEAYRYLISVEHDLEAMR